MAAEESSRAAGAQQVLGAGELHNPRAGVAASDVTPINGVAPAKASAHALADLLARPPAGAIEPCALKRAPHFLAPGRPELAAFPAYAPVTRVALPGAGAERVHFVCITFMPAYEDYSQEELRQLDYITSRHMDAAARGARDAALSGEDGCIKWGPTEIAARPKEAEYAAPDVARFVSITATPSFHAWSPEELRWQQCLRDAAATETQAAGATGRAHASVAVDLHRDYGGHGGAATSLTQQPPTAAAAVAEQKGAPGGAPRVPTGLTQLSRRRRGGIDGCAGPECVSCDGAGGCRVEEADGDDQCTDA
jgi:hypothetical protein